MNFKLLLVGLCGIPLVACDAVSTVNISATPVPYQIAIPAAPAAVNLNNINFKVVTKDSVNQFIKDQIAAQGNQDPVFIVVNSNGYQNLRLNIAELQRYIQQQKSIILYYKKEIKATTVASTSSVKK